MPSILLLEYDLQQTSQGSSSSFEKFKDGISRLSAFRHFSYSFYYNMLFVVVFDLGFVLALISKFLFGRFYF